jgi:hypothetical protein
MLVGTTTLTTAIRRSAYLAAILLLVASCGDDGGGGGGGGAPTAADDRKAASAFLLTTDDVPGFTKVPRPSNWPPVYAECGHDPLLPGSDSTEPVVTSFLRDDTARLRKLQVDGVESYSVMATTEAEAERTLALVADAGFRSCVQKGIEVAQEETVENRQVISSTIVDLAAPAPAPADGAAAFRVTVEEEFNHFDHELTVVRKGRALAFLFTGRLGTDSYPDSERHRLASVIAGRMP